jgi:hypothetical protein
MNPMLLLFTVIVAMAPGSCSLAGDLAEQKLLSVWFAPGLPKKQLAEAVNQHFTNGTPVSNIVQVLGPGYVQVTPYSMISFEGSPITCWLEYKNQGITIHTSARLGADPLAAKFTGAGYKIPLQSTTNKTHIGQPDGAANRSQPIRSETNRTPAAAGSDR